jgi:hypothetical protein
MHKSPDPFPGPGDRSLSEELRHVSMICAIFGIYNALHNGGRVFFREYIATVRGKIRGCFQSPSELGREAQI